MSDVVSLLRKRPEFRRLWIGETLSLVGDWLSYVAVSLLALAAGQGPWALAIVFAAHVLPTAFVSPWAGALADRIDRRVLLVGTQLLMAALMVAMVFAASKQALLAVELILFARTAVSGFFYPAKQAAIRALVDDEELVDANALDTATWSFAFTIGTALGGVIAMAGPVLALSIDALTFVLAAIVLAGLPKIPPPSAELSGSASSSEKRPTLTFLWSAFAIARKRGPLLEATLTKAPVAGAGAAAWLTLNYRAEFLGQASGALISTALAIGILQSSRGIGTGVGPLLAKRLIRRGVPASTLLRLSVVVCLVSIAGFALASGWVLSILAVVLWGLGSGGYWVFSATEIQRLSPPDMIGRLSAIDQLSMTLAMGIAAFVGAAAVSYTGSTDSAAWAGVGVGLLLYLLLRTFVASASLPLPAVPNRG